MAPGAAGADVVVDFAPGSDMIAISRGAFAAPGVPPGQLAQTRFAPGIQAEDRQNRLIYDRDSGPLWYDCDGSGALVPQLIATLQNRADLSASDIFVIA